MARVPSAAELRADADARRLSPALRAGASSGSEGLRRLATELVARIRGEAGLPVLDLALGDFDSEVRLHAARGVARIAGISAARREARITGALAVAREEAERAALLRLLGETLARSDSPALALALAQGSDAELSAACAAYARLAERGHVVPPARVARATELVELGEPGLAQACLGLLSAVASQPGALDAQAERLREWVTSGPRELRAGALRALLRAPGRAAGNLPELVAGSTEIPLALAAWGGLTQPAAASRIVPLVAAELQQHLDRPALLGGPRLHVLLAAFSAAERFKDEPAVVELADRALVAFVPHESDGTRIALGRGLAQCAATRLRDLARGWPGKTQDCGNGLVPETLRKVWMAELFALTPGSDELRAVGLGKLWDGGAGAVQLAVLRASSTLPLAHALPLVRRGLKSSSPEVLAAAAHAVTVRASELRTNADIRTDLLAAFSTAERAPVGALAWLGAARALFQAPRAAAALPGSSAPPPAPATATPPPGFPAPPALPAAPAPPAATPETPSAPLPAEQLTRLARHFALGVREPAQALLAEWGLPDPGPADAPPRAITPVQLPEPGTGLLVKLVTTAGTMELRLDVERAPVAAQRIVELARAGAFGNHAIQGLAAASWVAIAPAGDAGAVVLRHEDATGPPVRGSVVLQDRGRDCVSPTLVVVLDAAAMPARDATVVGEVIAGMDVADALNAADRVLEAAVEVRR